MTERYNLGDAPTGLAFAPLPYCQDVTAVTLLF